MKLSVDPVPFPGLACFPPLIEPLEAAFPASKAKIAWISSPSAPPSLACSPDSSKDFTPFPLPLVSWDFPIFQVPLRLAIRFLSFSILALTFVPFGVLMPARFRYVAEAAT